MEALLGSGILKRMLSIERPSPGSAEEFHHRDVPIVDDVRLWWFEPSRPAVVLGSTQSSEIVDSERCRQRGVDVVARRSGGGLVYVSNTHTMWADVIVPSGHSCWHGDIGRASEWIGEVWLSTLSHLNPTIHRGAMVSSPWSRTICFAGRGPGELFDRAGSKMVGISQRRTRDWARFQCAVSLRWEPESLLELLRVDDLTAADIIDAGATLAPDVNPSDIRASFERSLAAAVSG